MRALQSDPSKPSEWFRRQRATASIKEAAKTIFRKLERWDANKEDAKKKWVWELLQNARDVAQSEGKESFNVSIILNNNKLIFQHNAGPFSLSNISALLNARSDKPMESSDVVGEFGKGFIVTHILSGRVKIRGWIKDESIPIHRTFEILLDRTLQSSDELTVNHIAKNIDYCEKELDGSSSYNLNENITQFEYLLTDEGRKIAYDGLRTLEDVLPFILSFTKPKIEIRILKNGQERLYKVLSCRVIVSETVIIEELQIGCDSSLQENNGIILVSTHDSDVKISIPISKGSFKELNDIPRLFWMFPLLKTNNLELPVVVYAPFRVAEDRFDIQYRDQHMDELEEILQIVKILIVELSKWSLTNNIKQKEQLFKIKAPPSETSCRVQWIEALSLLVRELSQMKAVEVVRGVVNETEFEKEFLKPELVYFPKPVVGSDIYDDDEFLSEIWWLSFYFGLKVPSLELLEEWNDIRSFWEELGVSVGNDYTLENLVKETENQKNLINLTKKLSSKKDGIALTFLNRLYKTCQFYCSNKELVPEFLMRAIYSDQNGDFKRARVLYIDENIPVQLKKISDSLYESLSGKLLHENISDNEGLNPHFVDLGMDKMDENMAIDELYNAIHRNWKQRIKSMEINKNTYKSGVVEFEKWILTNKHYGILIEKHPLRELPFLCEDKKLRNSGGGYFIPPKSLLEEEAQEYIDIWPDNIRLSQEYCNGIKNIDAIKEQLVVADVIKQNILYYEEIELSLDQMKIMSDKPIRGSWKTKTNVSQVVAFTNALEYAEKSRKIEGTNKILEFILAFLVPMDDSWKERTVSAFEMSRPALAIPKPTGKKRDFSLFPCLWFVELGNFKWVIVSSTDEEGQTSYETSSPSERSLLGYVKGLKPSILDNEEVQDFLKLRFNFSSLEMTSWLLTGGKKEAEATLVDGLKQIHKLARDQGVDSMFYFSEFLTIMRNRGLRSQISTRNRNFGLIIEDIVRRVFELIKIREYGFLVIPTWKGFDFEAYLHRKAIEESDYGILSIEVERIKTKEIIERFEVEVKGTRVNNVAMTLTQAERAVDNIEKYLLCVVDAKDLSELDDIDDEILSKDDIDRLSKKIQPYLSIIYIGEYLKEIIYEFRKASSETPNISVDYEARFNIHSKLWKNYGISIHQWFNSLIEAFEVEN